MLNIADTQQVGTSRTRELQFQIDWLTKQLTETKAHSDLAWKIYNDACDEGDRENIEATHIIAQMFDAIRIATYRELDAAKRDYLALLN